MLTQNTPLANKTKVRTQGFDKQKSGNRARGSGTAEEAHIISNILIPSFWWTYSLGDSTPILELILFPKKRGSEIQK